MKTMKGQAAIEYMMNYGWAVLVLAIVMGAILFTGVFNPNYFVMEECYLGPALNCHAQLISGATDTTLLMNVSNRLGYRISLNDINFTSEDLGVVPVQMNFMQLANENSTIITAVFHKTAQKGTAKKFSINLTYYICADEVNPDCITASPAYLRFISGRVVAQAN